MASSFTNYLEKLRLAFDDMENVYVLESITDIERTKSQLSLRLGCKFEPLDTLDEVPRHRAQLGTEKSPAWVCIEPNRVPRAFLRTAWAGHERYGQLKELMDRMPGDALQHPELPADSFILEGPGGVPTELIDACADSQIALRPLREYIDVI